MILIIFDYDNIRPVERIQLKREYIIYIKYTCKILKKIIWLFELLRTILMCVIINHLDIPVKYLMLLCITLLLNVMNK